MTYNYFRIHTDEIKFEKKQTKNGCLYTIFTLFFLVFFLVLYLFFPETFYKYLYPAIFLLLTGIVLFRFPIKKVKYTTFDSLYINRKDKLCEFSATNGKAQISFSELSHFDIKTTSNSNNSSGSRTSNHKSYTYHLRLNLKDGSKFTLQKSGDFKKLETFKDQLNEFLFKTELDTNPITESIVPDNIEVYKLGNRLSFSWSNKNPYAAVKLIYIALILMAMIYTMAQQFLNQDSGMFWAFIFFLIFFLVVLGIIMFINLRMINQMNKYRFRLELNDETIRLLGLSKSGEKEFFNEKYTTHASFNIFYEGTGEINTYDRCLIFKNSLEDNSLSVRKKLINIFKNLLNDKILYLNQWSFIEVIKFRNILNQKLKNKIID